MGIKWIETQDAFVVQLFLKLRNRWEVKVDDLLSVVLGEQPNRLGHRELAEIIFPKTHWTEESAYKFWSDHQIYVVSRKRWGQKVPPVHFWLDLVLGVYILFCWRGAPQSEWKSVKSVVTSYNAECAKAEEEGG